MRYESIMTKEAYMRARPQQPTRRRLAAAAMLLAAGGLGACDSIMEVELPGNLTEEDLLQPASAATIVTSGIADFECAYSMFTTMSGAVEDTWWRATGYWGGWAEYRTERPGDGECADGDTSSSFATSFQKARLLSETAYNSITEWGDQVPDAERLLATSATYAGLTYQVLGETYCELTVDVGPILQPEEVLERSEQWFTTALDHMGATDFEIVSTTSLKQLALLGRARVRLAMGDLTGAAADAEQIQPDFVAYATRDASVRPRWNHVYRTLNVQGYSAVAGVVQWQGAPVPFTGYRQLTIDQQGRSTIDGFPVRGQGVPDPRVQAEFLNEFLQDGVTDNWAQQKYTSTDDDIPLARWAEAQLILAEVKGGAAAVPHVNAIRDVHGLPHYQGPTDAESIRDLIIEERRREFFLEGRFFAEKLRQGLWFPRNVGNNHKAVAYGNATCWMMPVSEYQNNPNVPDDYEGPY
jgi:starch-binding outer membrane protein, SusD/RagB family